MLTNEELSKSIYNKITYYGNHKYKGTTASLEDKPLTRYLACDLGRSNIVDPEGTCEELIEKLDTADLGSKVCINMELHNHKETMVFLKTDSNGWECVEY